MNSPETEVQVKIGTLLDRFQVFDCPQSLYTPAVWHNVNPLLDHRVQFTALRTSQELFNYLQSNALVLELWGLQGKRLWHKKYYTIPFKALGLVRFLVLNEVSPRLFNYIMKCNFFLWWQSWIFSSHYSSRQCLKICWFALEIFLINFENTCVKTDTCQDSLINTNLENNRIDLK